MNRLVLQFSPPCTSNISLRSKSVTRICRFHGWTSTDASIITNEKEWNLFRRVVVKYEPSYKLKQHKRLWK
jgi:hypothetical protein